MSFQYIHIRILHFNNFKHSHQNFGKIFVVFIFVYFNGVFVWVDFTYICNIIQ